MGCSDGGSKKFDKLFISKKYFDSINVPVDTIETVPPEIYLDDTEKFTDNDGNIIEIEVVGERDVNKCYFKVKDIMNGFGLKSLHKNIIDSKSGFIENTH